MMKNDTTPLELLAQPDWETYERASSGLPGPRANPELAHAAAQAGSPGQFEAWLANPDPDLHWLLRENLKKARLSRMDSAWVATFQVALATGARP